MSRTLAGVGEVHCWGVVVRAVPLRRPSRTEIGLLDGHERARADRFRFAADAADFLAGRVALRVFAGELLGVHPSALEADYQCRTCRAITTDHGRPRYRSRREGSVPLLSLSRADGWAVLAGASGDEGLRGVGVDAERVSGAGFAGFDDLVLTPRERLNLAPRSTVGGHQERARLWTRKEAFLKATGHGLRRDPASVDVSANRLEGVALADLDASRLGLTRDVVVALAAWDAGEGTGRAGATSTPRGGLTRRARG